MDFLTMSPLHGYLQPCPLLWRYAHLLSVVASLYCNIALHGPNRSVKSRASMQRDRAPTERDAMRTQQAPYSCLSHLVWDYRL